MKQKIVVVVGPNASGKSEFGTKLAHEIGGEIISADSRQVYKGLDVGSGKVRGIWKRGVFVYKNIPHHCIDIANPKKQFTALDFKHCAEKAVADILSRRKTPIIVGGTGFYIDAALGRVKLGGAPPNTLLRKKLAKKSVDALLKMLKKIDPERAKTIEQKNPRRLIRAIEIASGKTDVISDLILAQPALGSEASAFLLSDKSQRDRAKKALETGQKLIGFPQYNHRSIDTAMIKILWLGIKRLPEELKKRIHKRLMARLPGIIREVKKLHKNGVSWKRLFELGLEYRYASLYLRGKLDYKLITTQLQTAIWHYAKRQMTWFKKNKEIRWVSSL